MTRIIAGAAKGRRITVPPGRATRPTADRAREGLFSAVTALLGDLAGLRVLDLYAGSGAVGLEALSRGAAAATFVEAGPTALAALRSNLAALGLPGGSVVRGRVERVLGGEPDAPYDVVFADPPYADPVAGVLAALRRWVAPGALVVVERASRDPELDWPAGFEALRARRYGEGTLWYGRAT